MQPDIDTFKKMFKDALQAVEEFRKKVPFDEEYIMNYYKALEKKLVKEKKISLCKNCRMTFKYYKGKKYCSNKCRKKAESKRYYKKHQKKLKKIKRVDMQDTRKFYKERGVKK
jgi:ferredoxin